MLPTTLLLAFVINYTGEEMAILWLHLGLLLFLLGLTSYKKLLMEPSKTDYSESTSLDTLGGGRAHTWAGLCSFCLLGFDRGFCGKIA